MQKEGFVLLYDIGIISQEILSFKRQAKDLPKEIKELRSGIDTVEASIDKNRATIERFEDEIRDASLSMEDAKSHLADSEQKVPSISNNEEYDAIYKEISNFKGKIKSLTNKISVLNDDKDALDSEINELLEVLEEKKQASAADISSKEKALGSLEVNITKKKAEISDIATKLDEISPDIAKVFRKLENLSNGNVSIGFVDVESKGAHCSRCFSILPLQQKAKIRDNSDVCVCENCSSILVSSSYSREEA